MMGKPRRGAGGKGGGRKRGDSPFGFALTRDFVKLLSPQERAALAERIGLDASEPGGALVEWLSERLCDPDWLLGQTKDLSWLARCALLAAAWTSPHSVLALSGAGVGGLDVPAALVARAGEELDRSGLWFEHAGPFEDARVVLPAASAVLRRRTADLLPLFAELEWAHGTKPPARRFVDLLAAISTVGARLRKDGSLYVKAAERVVGLCPVLGDDLSDSARSLGVLARVALRVGWLEERERDGTLSLRAEAFVEAAPSYSDVIAVILAAATTVIPPLGAALAVLAGGPGPTVLPLRVLSAMLCNVFDARIPGDAKLRPQGEHGDHGALLTLLMMSEVLVPLNHEGERLTLAHPDVRAMLRAEPTVAAIGAATVQGSLEVLLPPDCSAGQLLRLASISDLLTTDVVDRARLSPERMLEAVESGVSADTLRGWLLDAVPTGELPPNIEHLLESLSGADDLCAVYPGVPLRLGARALRALVADPKLGPLVLSTTSDGQAVLDTRALPLLIEWARRNRVRLRGLGFWEVLHTNQRVPQVARPVDWRPISAHLSVLVSELLDPVLPSDPGDFVAEIELPAAFVGPVDAGEKVRRLHRARAAHPRGEPGAGARTRLRGRPRAVPFVQPGRVGRPPRPPGARLPVGALRRGRCLGPQGPRAGPDGLRTRAPGALRRPHASRHGRTEGVRRLLRRHPRAAHRRPAHRALPRALPPLTLALMGATEARFPAARQGHGGEHEFGHGAKR